MRGCNGGCEVGACVVGIGNGVGLGVGDGVGLGVGDGEGVGVGDGDGEAVTIGDVAGAGEPASSATDGTPQLDVVGHEVVVMGCWGQRGLGCQDGWC